MVFATAPGQNMALYFLMYHTWSEIPFSLYLTVILVFFKGFTCYHSQTQGTAVAQMFPQVFMLKSSCPVPSPSHLPSFKHIGLLRLDPGGRNKLLFNLLSLWAETAAGISDILGCKKVS